jgi:hypothetical protein
MSMPARPSRRAVVGAAAWTAPVVVVAAAAPAYATSEPAGTPALVATVGSTYSQRSGTSYAFFHARGMAVTTSNVALDAGYLFLQLRAADGVYVDPVNSNGSYGAWTQVSGGSLTGWVYGAAVQSGATVSFPNAVVALTMPAAACTFTFQVLDSQLASESLTVPA